METMKRDLSIAAGFTKYSYKWHLLIVLLFGLFSGTVISYRNLNMDGCAAIMEKYAVFAGIILFAPLLLPEQDWELWQLERSKAMTVYRMECIRIIEAMLFLLIVVAGFLLAMKRGNSEFDMWLLGRGAYVEILFLGSIAFFFSAVTNQVIIGYMMSVIYYIVNLSAPKYLWKFALFEMRKGCFDFWGWMLSGAVILIIGGVLIREKYTAFY